MDSFENPFSEFLKSQAETLLLRAGFPPLIYENGRDQELSSLKLKVPEVLSILETIIPDAQQESLKESGFEKFEFQTEHYRFCVDVTWNESIKEIRFCKQI